MLKKEFEYKLIEGFDFQNTKAQKLETAQTLTMIAPSMNNRSYRTILQQSLMRAISDLQSRQNLNQSEEKQSQDALTGAMIFSILSTSSINLEDCYNAFEKLLIGGLCKINSSVNLTADLFKKISLDDIECMLGEYIANFLIPSGMKQIMKS